MHKKDLVDELELVIRSQYGLSILRGSAIGQEKGQSQKISVHLLMIKVFRGGLFVSYHGKNCFVM